MHRFARPAGLLPILILLTLCSAPAVIADDRLRIYTVNYPLAYFAERIAGDLAEIRFPVPPDVDPAFWMPDPETIAAYQTADLVLLNGAGYAKWTDKVSLPRSRLVDTSRAFKDAHIRQSNGVSHSHGPGGEHEHGGVAFTTWLDLDQAARQADAIAQALTLRRPGAKEQIDRNLQALRRDLLDLDARITATTRTNPGLPLLASHPVYQYMTRRYGLNLRSLMWEPQEVPNESQWAELEGILRKHPANWMLWEGEPATETAERLDTLGVDSIPLHPCGNRPSEDDFLTVMSQNARNLDRVFRQVSRDMSTSAYRAQETRE